METKKKKTALSGKKSGFTLIEILLVVTIIGVLLGIALPKITGRGKEAKMMAAGADINSLSMGITEYEMKNGKFPSSLDELISKENGGPYLNKLKVPLDPWGNSYQYQAPGANNTHSFDLYTEFEGTSINNWE